MLKNIESERGITICCGSGQTDFWMILLLSFFNKNVIKQSINPFVPKVPFLYPLKTSESIVTRLRKRTALPRFNTSNKRVIAHYPLAILTNILSFHISLLFHSPNKLQIMKNSENIFHIALGIMR